jgi:V/A-type H+-transporting ATPase subunit I
MIVKMKKVSLVVLDTLREESLKRLRKLGVLHLEQRPASSSRLLELESGKALLERTLLLLPQEKKEGKGAARAGVADSLELAKRVGELVERERALTEELDRLSREAERLSVWGEYDPEEIRALQDKGIDLRLYEAGRAEFESLPEGLQVFVLSRSKTLVRFAVARLADSPLPELEALPLPRFGLVRLQALIAEKESELASLRGELEGLAAHRDSLRAAIFELESRIEFEQARAGMGVDEQLAYLAGYVPDKKLPALRKSAADNGWALLVQEPADEDPVPTLVENPRWIRIISPVLSFLGTVPGYREYDFSFWFLLFFSLFFAMLIGDAGYGLCFMGLTLFARLKIRKAPAGPFVLLLVLSVATVVWGAITGTWFGVEYLATRGFLSRFVLPEIASFGADNAGTIMVICFLIGAVHLSIAHLINTFRYLPDLRGIAQIGWFAVVWGMYFVIRFIVLQLPLHPAGVWLVGGGLVLVVIFEEQKGKFFKGLLVGLASLPLKLLDSVSAFSDVISYVRLFAVGLATLEVAKSFNAMAANIGFGLPAGLIAAAILFLGHALNIMMGALSVIVHGVRLNMLEFSGHLGMEWTGTPYKPFAEKTEE